MGSRKVWATSEDGTIEFIQLTKENTKKACEMMYTAFYEDENICISVGLPENPNAISELEELTLRAGKDGVSVIGVDKESGKIAGAAFNKIQVSNPDDESYFEKYAAQCKCDSSKALVQFMIDADSEVNLFDHCKIDCLMEIMFLATSRDFRGRGVGRKLCEVSIELARSLKQGNNVKISLDGGALPLEPRPKAVSAIFTSFISQKIGRQLDFTIAIRIPYQKFNYKGRSFLERVGHHTRDCTLEFVKL